MMPKLSVSTYIHLAIVILFVGLMSISKYLWNKNTELKTEITKITLVYTQKIEALEVCSINTTKLKDREKEITKAAQEAVAEAKKESKKNYDYAQQLLRKRPVQPVVTNENEKEFGGDDPVVQLKDYLATKKLINDYILDKEGQ